MPGAALPRKILEHRQIAKLKGTYVDALPELVNPNTGRVHASFNQTVASTGRLSSSDPNLQNIPVRREQGQQIRQAFLPDEGWLLLTADYSQIELRLLAHFCGDEEMRQAFAEDRDIHAAVAAPDFRRAGKGRHVGDAARAKTVNFGVHLRHECRRPGAAVGDLARRGGGFIDAYFARYPQVLEYQDRAAGEVPAHAATSTTILGRRRASTARPSADSTYQQRNQPEREAINMEIQGSAADLIKLAMLNVYRRLQREELACADAAADPR